MKSVIQADMGVSARAFEQAVIPSMPDELFEDVEGTEMDLKELTDWITQSGLRFEHKHSKEDLRGHFVMRALRHNGQPTDLQKFVELVLQNADHILGSLFFTRTFGSIKDLGPGDYDLVEADSLVDFLSVAAEEVFGYEGAIRELRTKEGVKQFLGSGAVDTVSMSNATFKKVAFEYL